MIESTLCYISENNKYLMLHRVKKENDTNKDKWIGIGGKTEPGETPEECIRREVTEETGLTLNECNYRGIVYFHSDEYEDETMHLFTSESFSGTLCECDEGNLEWIDKREYASLPQWEGDKLFLHLIECNHPFFTMSLYYEGENLVSVSLDGIQVDKNDAIFE